MAKWFGKIGYALTEETEPGIWVPNIVEKTYFGDVNSDRWRRQNSGQINDDINLAMTISVVSDQYAFQHCSNIAYVEYMGSKWKVTDIDPQHPRLLLTLGGVYNG